MEDRKHRCPSSLTVRGQDPASASPGGLLDMQHLSPAPVMDSDDAMHPMRKLDLGQRDCLIPVPTNTSNLRSTCHKYSDLLITEVLCLYHINKTPRESTIKYEGNQLQGGSGGGAWWCIYGSKGCSLWSLTTVALSLRPQGTLWL